jgi:uncharacterized DUF497 family protein
MIYEWDEAKNRSNSAKHGLDFADAEQVLSGPCVTFVDDRFDYGEERLITLGLLAGRVVVIAHAPRGADITRISALNRPNGRDRSRGLIYRTTHANGHGSPFSPMKGAERRVFD